MSSANLSREGTQVSEHHGVPPFRSDTVEPGDFGEHHGAEVQGPPRMGIAIPPNTPSLGMVQHPREAPPMPIQPPRHSNVPLSSYQLYQQADGEQGNASLNGDRRKMHLSSLMPSSSQQLRASISRPTSPRDSDRNRVKDHSALVQGSAAMDTVGRTPIGQRGGRVRSQTVSVPTFTSHNGNGNSAVPPALSNALGGGTVSDASGSSLPAANPLGSSPAKVNFASTSTHSLRHNNNQNNNFSQSGEGDAQNNEPGFVLGRNVPGFDRNQHAMVFFSPTHYADTVPMEKEGDHKGGAAQQHRFRGVKGSSAYLGPIFSALGGGGSPVFGPAMSPGGAAPMTQLNLDDEGNEAGPSLYDPMAASQRDGHHTNPQEGIISSLSRRRYVLPPKAAAHALTVANDNIAAAGLGNLFGTRQGQSTASSILNMLMGAGGGASPPDSGNSSNAPPSGVSPVTPSSMTPAASTAKNFPIVGQHGVVHVVPIGARRQVESEDTSRDTADDPLQLTGVMGNSGRVSRVPTGKAYSTNTEDLQGTRSGAALMSIIGSPSGSSRTANVVQPQTLAAVHKYQRAQPAPAPHSPAFPARARGSPAFGMGGTFYNAHRSETAPPSLSMMGAGDQGEQEYTTVADDTVADHGSPKALGDAPTGRRPTDANSVGFSNMAFRYAPLYYNLDTTLSAIHQSQQQHPRPRTSAVSAPPMPAFYPIEGGEDFPDTSESDAEGTKVFGSNQDVEDDGGLHFKMPGTRPSEGFPGFGSISAGEDAPPLIVAARRAAESAKKRQRRRERRENPPFSLPPKPSEDDVVGVPAAVSYSTARGSRPIAKQVYLRFNRIAPSIPAAIPGVAPIPPTAADIASLIYTHPPRDPLAVLLRNVSPLSVPLTWSLEFRRLEERYFLLDTVRMAKRLGMCGSTADTSCTPEVHRAAHALPQKQKVAVLQSLPPPPYLSPKAIASEVILDAPATHGLFASFERSGTLLELARFCRSYPDALHFLEKVLQEADDPMSASNKAIAFKKTSLAKDIIESRERRRQRRMEKKGRFDAAEGSPSEGVGDSSSSMVSSDDEGSDLEDLMLNNLGTNLSYQMDVVLPLFPQLEDVVTLLKASCQSIRPEDTEEYKRDIEAATFTVDRLITALDPALHAEPSLSWPFHVLCGLACFFVTALKVGFVPLLKSLRKGTLASSGKGILAALAVSLTCKECLAVDDIAGIDPALPSKANKEDNLRYNPSDPFHYTNRNSEAEGHFYTDEEHQNHDLTLRKFLSLEAEDSLPRDASSESDDAFTESERHAKSSLTRRIAALRSIRLQYYRERLAEIGASPSRFCTLLPTVGANAFYTDTVFTEITSPSQLKKHIRTVDRSNKGGEATSFKKIAYLADNFNAFEHAKGIAKGESDSEEDELIRIANETAGASIPLRGTGSSHQERKVQDQERRAQIIALQNERCEVIFFKHCVEALRAAQGVGLAVESLRATNNIKPTTLISPDGGIIEPDDNEEERIAAAAESGGESSDDERVSPMQKKKLGESSGNVSLSQKDTIANVNSKCSILLVNVDVTIVRILVTAANDGLSSWVGVESSIAAAAAARRGAQKSDDTCPFGNEGEKQTILRDAEKRRMATLKAADNPNSASRGATTVVGTIELSRIFCSRSLVVSGHPSDIARFDLLLIQYGAFSGDRIHRDKLPIESPENHSQYCGDMLQTAIMRIWKGVQHGYTYRADHNRLIAQRRKERAQTRISRRKERMHAKAERKRQRMEQREQRRQERESRASGGRNTHVHEDLIFGDSDSSSLSEGDDAEAHYYADLAALAVESPLDNDNTGVDQDLHDFERATRFFLSFLVHPSELGIDLLHPVTGESMRVNRGGLVENSNHSQGIAPRTSAAQDLEMAYTARTTQDPIMNRLYYNNDPSAQYRARYGGGYMNKARLRDAWAFTENLSNAIVSSRQNLGASLDTIRQQGALRQRQRAAKHAEADAARYSANRQAVYDCLLREIQGDTGESEVIGLFEDPIAPQPMMKGGPGESASFSQAAIASSRYGHQKELLLDFSFSRLRVGQVLSWAQSSTQAGAFVTPNAANSAANDIVCVPQPTDMIDAGAAMLKPPKRGTRGDVVARTWLQLSIINRALTTHVPRVLVSETTTVTSKNRSSLITAAERLKKIDSDEYPNSPAQREEVSRQLISSNFDVADARLLDSNSTPRVYSVNDNFVQFRLLRSVFFHAVNADPGAGSQGQYLRKGFENRPASPKALREGASSPSNVDAVSPDGGIDLLNALTVQDRIERTDAEVEDSDSDDSFIQNLALPNPNDISVSISNMPQGTARGKGALYIDANASPLDVSNSVSTNGWAAPTMVCPPTRDIPDVAATGGDEQVADAGVGNLLCFIDSLGQAAVPDHITPIEDPSQSRYNVVPSIGSPSAQLLLSFDNAVGASLPFGLSTPTSKSSSVHNSGKERVKAKKASARRALRSYMDVSKIDVGRNLKAFQSARSFHNIFGPDTPFGTSVTQKSNKGVPIIDIGFGGQALMDGDDGKGQVTSGRDIGNEIHTRLKTMAKGLKRAKEMFRGRSEKSIMIATLLSATRYRAWVGEGHDYGANGLARMRRAGVDLAIGPQFSMHLMNVERHQKLSLLRGLRFLKRKQQQFEMYASRYLSTNDRVLEDVTAVPAPPAPSPFSKEDLFNEFACNWLRAMRSGSPEIPDPSRLTSSQVAGTKEGKIAKKSLGLRQLEEGVKIAVVEPFSASSYDMLKSICDYNSAEGLIRMGGGDLLSFGKQAASGSPQSRASLHSSADAHRFSPSLLHYLKNLFTLYIGSPSSDTALDVAEIVRELGGGVSGSATASHTQPNVNSAQEFDGGIGEGADRDHSETASPDAIISPFNLALESPSPFAVQDQRTADALKALRNAPPVTVIPLDAADRPQFITQPAQPSSRDEEKGNSPTRTTGSRAPTPVSQTNAARALRQSISGGAFGSRGPSISPAADSCCVYCGTVITNARALRIHSSYCEGVTLNSNVPSQGATPTTSPQLNNQGTPLVNGLSRNPSVPNLTMGNSGNILGAVLSRTNSLQRQRTGSQLTSPTFNPAQRVGSGSNGTGPSNDGELGSRSVSAGSNGNALKRFDLQDGTFHRTGSNASHASANRRLHADGAPLLQTAEPTDQPQSQRSWALPAALLSGDSSQADHSTASLRQNANATDPNATVNCIRQATVLHALLMSTAGSTFEAGGGGNGTSPVSPNPPTSGCGSLKTASKEGGGRVTVLTTSQSESMTVIDAAATHAVYGSATLRDTGPVLGGYQFLVANPTLKNECDAVVLDLLQYIESLRNTLLVKQEQLYQQALVAYQHLQSLRNAVLRSPTQPISLPLDTLPDAASPSDLIHSTPSPQTPQSPRDGIAGPVNVLLKNPHVHIVLLTHHIREVLSAVDGCKRRREVLHGVAANYHRVKTGVMLTPQALQFTENLSRLTDLPFPIFTLLVCPTVLQLLDFWDVMEFTSFYCGS